MSARTIVLKGDPVRKEGKAAGAITPGHLIQFDGSGALEVHDTAGGNARKAFAVENEVIGKGIGDAYAQGDWVLYGVFRPGDEVYALVPASAAAIVEGDALESAGDGTLRKHTPPAIDEGGAAEHTIYVDAIVGYALEDVDNSAGVTPARIKVEVA